MIDRNNVNMTSTQNNIEKELEDINSLLNELHDLCEKGSKYTFQDKNSLMMDCIKMVHDLQESINKTKRDIRNILINEEDSISRKQILDFQEKFDSYVIRTYKDVLVAYESLQSIKKVEFEEMLLRLHSFQDEKQLDYGLFGKLSEKMKEIENKVATTRKMLDVHDIGDTYASTSHSSLFSKVGLPLNFTMPPSSTRTFRV